MYIETSNFLPNEKVNPIILENKDLIVFSEIKLYESTYIKCTECKNISYNLQNYLYCTICISPFYNISQNLILKLDLYFDSLEFKNFNYKCDFYPKFNFIYKKLIF